jgi:hypothetical protein
MPIHAHLVISECGEFEALSPFNIGFGGGVCPTYHRGLRTKFSSRDSRRHSFVEEVHTYKIGEA